VSASWLACMLTLDRWVPKWTPFFMLFWAPTDRYLRAWKPVPSCLQFDQQRPFSRFFSLLPTAAFSTIMARRKATAVHHGLSWHRQPRSAKLVGHQYGTLNTPTDGYAKGRNATSAPGTVRPLLRPRSRRQLGVESPTSSAGPSLG
jgi:hypothetical protein